MGRGMTWVSSVDRAGLATHGHGHASMESRGIVLHQCIGSLEPVRTALNLPLGDVLTSHLLSPMPPLLLVPQLQLLWLRTAASRRSHLQATSQQCPNIISHNAG
jgi:hypothetical protein